MVLVIERRSNSALQNKSSPARLTAGLLNVRTTGRIRTYDPPFSQKVALSPELQRYAIWNLD
jgi:hypothetical protein